jgi:hypothetical protein
LSSQGKEQDEKELHQTKPKTDEHEKKKTLGFWLYVCVILLSTQKTLEDKNTTDSRKNKSSYKNFSNSSNTSSQITCACHIWYSIWSTLLKNSV